MILRDAIFSAERRHLGAQSVPARLSTGRPAGSAAHAERSVDEDAATYEMRARRSAAVVLGSRGELAGHAGWRHAHRARRRMLSDELASLRDSAQEEGYARGHAEAMKEAREKVGSAIAVLETLNIEAETGFARELAQLRKPARDIVAEVFFKLAGSALATREAIVGVVAEVLKRVREERELRIHVNPQDLPRVAHRRGRASPPACRAGSFTLVADARVEAGGCIVESALGSLDGRLEVQLAGLVRHACALRKDPGARA